MHAMALLKSDRLGCHLSFLAVCPPFAFLCLDAKVEYTACVI